MVRNKKKRLQKPWRKIVLEKTYAYREKQKVKIEEINKERRKQCEKPEGKWN